jgi:undecaprenyl pyrophosphate phosphatase UppP
VRACRARSAAALAAGVVASAGGGLLTLHGLLRWLGRTGFGVSCVYRVAFAGVILAWLALR